MTERSGRWTHLNSQHPGIKEREKDPERMKHLEKEKTHQR